MSEHLKDRHESGRNIGRAAAETRNRRKWAYVREDELRIWATREKIDGGDEQLVRLYFKEAMIAEALRREAQNDLKMVMDANAVPKTYNPEAKVESGIDPNDVKFFAIWFGLSKEPEFPPTFQ